MSGRYEVQMADRAGCVVTVHDTDRLTDAFIVAESKRVLHGFHTSKPRTVFIVDTDAGEVVDENSDAALDAVEQESEAGLTIQANGPGLSLPASDDVPACAGDGVAPDLALSETGHSPFDGPEGGGVDGTVESAVGAAAVVSPSSDPLSSPSLPRGQANPPSLPALRSVCAWCGSVKDEGEPGARTTHGICPACREREIGNLRRALA